ncbi:MAG: Fic family protein [Idiomarina sp.]|nr:Fic family protein [Idiomarina sp.]
MRDKYGVSHDSYCYEGTDVLINKLNIRDAEELAHAEAEFTTLRYQGYRSNPLNITQYNFNHLKTLHHHLFQDLYTWAGEVRSIDISKGDTRFCTSSRIEAEALRLFSQLPELTQIRNRQEMLEFLADSYCEINLLHPFREGNGRTQRFFYEEVMFALGYELIWPKLPQEQWVEANVSGVHLNLSPLINIFDQALRKL